MIRDSIVRVITGGLIVTDASKFHDNQAVEIQFMEQPIADMQIEVVDFSISTLWMSQAVPDSVQAGMTICALTKSVN